MVDASTEQTVLTSQITTLAQDVRDLIYSIGLELEAPECLLIERASENEMAWQLPDDLMKNTWDEVIGSSFGLKSVMDLVHQVAPQPSSVLFLGETGVGEDVIALALHRLSPRSQRPFSKINCGVIPPGLMESEIFGHEKGAFTGALSRRRGCFERADGGSLLLD